MDAPYAKLSIRGGSKVKIAPVHPDFGAALLAPGSLMGFADWLLHRLHALEVLRAVRASPITV